MGYHIKTSLRETGEEGVYILDLKEISSLPGHPFESFVAQPSLHYGIPRLRFDETRWTQGPLTEDEGTFFMSELPHIKEIFRDIEQLRNEQDQHFTTLEKTLQGIKDEVKGLREEIGQHIKDAVTDLKEGISARFDPFEKSVDTRFEALSFLTKLVGGGILAILVTLVVIAVRGGR